MSVNKVILLGNVGRDPDVRYPSQGQTVASFPLATSDRAYRTQAGTQVPERTEWHNIVMWGKNAEVSPRNTSAREVGFISKDDCAHATGKTRTKSSDTSPRYMSTLLKC